MKRLDNQVLDKLATHLDELPPRQNLRPYDIVAGLAERYSGTRDRGYNLDDFVSALAQYGIQLTRNTVRNYLSRARAAQRRPSSEPRARHMRNAANRDSTEGDTKAGVRLQDERSAIAESADAPPHASLPNTTQASVTTEAKQSVMERARARGITSSADDLPTPGSFRIRPDTEDL